MISKTELNKQLQNTFYVYFSQTVQRGNMMKSLIFKVNGDKTTYKVMLGRKILYQGGNQDKAIKTYNIQICISRNKQ